MRRDGGVPLVDEDGGRLAVWVGREHDACIGGWAVWDRRGGVSHRSLPVRMLWTLGSLRLFAKAQTHDYHFILEQLFADGTLPWPEGW